MRIGLILLVAILLAPASHAAALRPNILLLMAEDMSSRVGVFGDTVAVTPTLDALASESVRYTNVFTTAGVCAPSRAAHILGMNQISTGTQHMRSSGAPQGGYYAVPPVGVKAYPELLRAAGYYTFTDQKLDYQFSSPFPGSGPLTIWDSEGEANPLWQDRAPGQPFFGFRNFMVTHESGIFLPLGEMPNSAMHFVMQLMRWWRIDGDITEVVSPQQVILPPYYPDTPTVRSDVARHYNNVAAMDKEVAAILKQLEVDGLADSTIVIWTTDHGDGLPRAKRELYDSGIKVPMLIRWPEAFRPEGVQPSSVDQRLISFLDLAPTILKLAGVELPGYLQGQDFASPSPSTRALQREYIYAARDRIDEVLDRQRAVRDHRFKYIRSWQPDQIEGHELEFRDNLDMVREMRQLHEQGKLNAAQSLWFEAAGEERLFDLEKDPFEINDVSEDPQYAEDLQRLRKALTAWQARVGDMSDESEEKMAARFAPGGEQQITPTPKLDINGDTVTATATSPDHSIAYRVDEGPWHLYTVPFSKGLGSVEVKAVRYGWEHSESVSSP
ncbi:MAG: N-sulfoglucosamine sulfohydrolase [Halioglobus sp.]|jgi:N-sulfoglucosamine sulfohydrolase